MYIRVFGILKSFSGKRYILPFGIRIVEDFNEITYHFLETTYAHLLSIKGEGRIKGTMDSTEDSHHQQLVQDSDVSDVVSPVARHVLDAIKALTKSKVGVSVDQLAEHLKSVANIKQIREALEFLEQHAYIYTTIDSDHYATH